MNIQKRVGYVFRDRYYVQIITTVEQLWNCIAYIHNNPVKAEIVEKPENYNFSSYKEYKCIQDLITEESIELVFGGFIDLEDLMNVKGIGTNKFEKIKEYICL